MDFHLMANSQDESIRKIEDIIDIQKAKGNFNVKQVAFNVSSQSNFAGSTNITKSLESGLSIEKCKSGNIQKKLKKLRSNRSKSPLPDVISWPSESDITVLRMKLGSSNKDLKLVFGDGLHQPDSSSMVNLATLLAQSQPPSKHSMAVEEYLLPLTSWELQETPDADKEAYCAAFATKLNTEAMCSRERDTEICLNAKDSDYSKNTTKSKIARFLRLYFCPCCTCLYRIEKMQEEPSSYFTKRNATC